MNKYFYYSLDDNIKLTGYEHNIMLKDYEELIDILSLLTQELFEAKVKDENWRYYIETISIKFIFHSLNLIAAYKGVKHFSKYLSIDSTLFDLSTNYLLHRVLLENYLTFNYLFIQPADRDEQRFRWIIYEIAGYNARQQYNPNLSLLQEKLKNEKIIIEKLEAELKTNSYFQKLEQGKQKSILKDKPAKLYGWKRILELSPLNADIFTKHWNLCSNYAHSEFISLMQIKDYYQNKDMLFDTKTDNLFIIIILTASYITDIIKTFSAINEKFQSLDHLQRDCIIFLSSIAKNKNIT